MKEIASLESKRKGAGNLGRSLKNTKDPLIAFFLTIISYLALLVISRVHPFGPNSILMSDLEAQYAPFLYMYKEMLGSASSLRELTYSFMMGMGKNTMGTFGYYLASPFNFLVLLFTPAQVSEFITLLIVLKLAFASSFMCMFLRKRSTVPSKWPILFGVVYAFSSFVMIFMFNIMWLDGYMLLPLVLYFTECYIHTGKRTGLTISLLVLFISNYYIAYMVGIYVFLYLLVRMYTEGMFKDKKAAAGKVFKFIATAALCGFTLCAMILPVGLDTIRNADPTHFVSDADHVDFAVADIVDQIFLGEQGDFLSHNLPYLFLSLSVTSLCVLFFVSKATPAKEKKVYAILFIGVYLVLSINALDKAWQVFDTPNWFFHRESFVFYPLFLVVALKTIERIREISNKEITTGLCIMLGLIIFAQSFGQMKEEDLIFLFNIFYVAALMGLFMLMKKEDWHEQLKDMPKLMPFLLALSTVVEVSLLAPVMSSGLSSFSLKTYDSQLYSDSINAICELSSTDYQGKTGFRSELEIYAPDQSGDSVDDVGSYYGGYNGVSFFNSNSNKQLHRFLKQFGYTVNYDYFSEGYGYTALDTDTFLSVGSVMTRADYSDGTLIATDTYGDGLSLYSNGEVLPLAFSVPGSAYDLDFYSLEAAQGEKNYFAFRDSWFASLFPEEFEDAEYFVAPETEPVPELINCTVIDTTLYMGGTDTSDDQDTAADVFDYDDVGAEIDGVYRNDITTIYRVNESIPMILNYEITAERADELYLNISNARCLGECKVYVNGKYLAEWSDGSFYSSIVRIGAFEEGEVINVSIVSDADSFGYVDINFAYLDDGLFTERRSLIDTSDVQLVSVSGGDVVINADLKAGDTILTTIPYEDGWTLTVDGAPQDIKVYQGALIGIDCGSGSHQIHLTFTPPGMKTGAMVSCAGIVGLIALALTDHIKPKKKVPVTK
ncbi:Uncharacterized membrane protein YfhO [Ruminococcaceae bacterium KH2T8]|nr:Uncharacterized membrane protein YfhO [Ruminococcaceae bacterium KH2T8]